MIERARRSVYPVIRGRMMAVLGLCLALSLLAFEMIPVLDLFTPVQGIAGALAVLFVPGWLVLHASGIECQQRLKFLVYATGVSLAYVLVVGIASLSLFAVIGVSRPFDAMPWAFSGSLLALSVLVFWQGAETRWTRAATVSPRCFLSILLFVLLPVLSVATSVAPAETTLIASLILIGLLACTVALLGVGAIPTSVHPLAVWSVAMAVLLQMTLVSSHLWGWDIHSQYATARSIAQHGLWTPGFGIEEQSLLSVTLGAALYSSVTGLELVWVYKLLYPIIVSLLPVTLYYLAKSQFEDERIAVLAPFCLIFYYGYFKIFPGKQIIAQLFFALALLVIYDTAVNGIRKRALAVVFGTMMIVSHYGISLLFVGFLVATGVLGTGARFMTRVRAIDPRGTRPTFVSFIGVGWVLWYLFSASGVNFERVVLTGYESWAALGGGDASSRDAFAYFTEAYGPPLWVMYKLVVIALIGFIAIGVIWTVVTTLTGRNEQPDREFVIFAAVTLLFLGSSIKITYGMGFDRTLLLSLTVLAPFALIGFRVILRQLSSVTVGDAAPGARATASMFGIFLAILFLLSSGAVFAVAGQPVPAYSISLDDDTGWPVYAQSEVDATRWLSRSVPPQSRIAVYNDWEHLKGRDALLVREVVDPDRIELVWLSRTELSNVSYFYVSDQPMALVEGNDRTYIDPRDTPIYHRHLQTSDFVYAGEDVRIYRLRQSDNSSHRGSNVETNATDAR